MSDSEEYQEVEIQIEKPKKSKKAKKKKEEDDDEEGYADAVPGVPKPEDFEEWATVSDPNLVVYENQDPGGEIGIAIGKGSLFHRLSSGFGRLLSCEANAAMYLMAADMVAFIATWSLLAILGYTTGRVTEYQDRGGKIDIDNLPPTVAIYIALGVFATLKVIQGLLVYLSARQEGYLKERLMTTYGKLIAKAEMKARIKIPTLTMHDYDTFRAAQGMVGLVLVIVGCYFAWERNELTTGLLLGVAGAAVFSNAIIGFVETQKAVLKGAASVVGGMVTWVGNHPGLDVNKLQDELNDVRNRVN